MARQTVYETARFAGMLGLALACLLVAHPLCAQASDAFPDDMAEQSDREVTLNLLVILNGRDTGIIAEFRLASATGALSATRQDLADAGITAPQGMGNDIALDAISGLQTVYDEASQTITLTLPTAMLVAQELSARPASQSPESQPGWGLVLNYRATGNFGDDVVRDGFRAKALYAGLDLRAYLPFGVLQTTGAISTHDSVGGAVWRRHDTAFVHVAQEKMVVFTLGDFSSTGVDWTQPVRMAGLQIRRDFSLNQTFITDPLLSYSGVAVLPSGVDVFINNVRAWSGKVDAGPFTLSDVPMVTPQGEAVFVLRDPSGQEHISRVSFFSTQNLLRKGVADYSFQIGRAREDYGEANFAYGEDLMGSASLRYGLTNGLTLNGHLEGNADLLMLGGGLDTTLFNRAEISVSGAYSESDAGRGRLLDIAINTKVAGIDLRASQRHSFGHFEDLAAHLSLEHVAQVEGVPRFAATQSELAVSLSMPLKAISGYAGLSYIHSVRAGDTASILSASYAQSLGKSSTALRINAFRDLSDTNSMGISVGLSVALGPAASGGIQVTQTPAGVETQVSASQQAGYDRGDTGYRLALYRQDGGFNSSLSLTHQGRYSRSDLTLKSKAGAVALGATTTGALVLAGGAVFLSNPIKDGFAVVDVGVPGIAVSLNNRPATVTGRQGRALVPALRSYQTNRISIDPLTLPANVTISATAMDVVPRRGSGVAVSFGGSTDTSALVVLRDTAGAFLLAGTEISLDGSATTFAMGYDGEVWMEGLKDQNRIFAVTASGKCTADFDFVPDASKQVYIEDVVCK